MIYQKNLTSISNFLFSIWGIQTLYINLLTLKKFCHQIIFYKYIFVSNFDFIMLQDEQPEMERKRRETVINIPDKV